MNYEDECAGYDDVYGHSVEESDFCVSPSTAERFMFDRTRRDQLSSFVPSSNQPIVETNEDDDEEYEEAPISLSDSTSELQQHLSDFDRARLNSCIESMQNIMGETTPEAVMINAALQNAFDPNAAADFIMNQMEAPKPQRDARNRRNRGAAVRPTAGDKQTTSKPETEPVASSGAVGCPEVKVSSKTQPLGTVAVETKVGPSVGKEPVEATSKRPLKPDAGTTAGPVSQSFKGDAVSAADATPKTKSSKDPYAEKRLNTNEFSDVGSEELVLVTPRREGDAQSGAVGQGLPKSASRAKMDRLDAQKEYEKRKADGKDFINLVVIGHVDAGKSTLMGHVLFQLGFVNKRTMHKYEQDSKKLGKGSFAYAWVLDETEEERSRGVTMDIAQTKFETRSKVVTLLDAPGHRDFIPNMITGAAQADVAILVINAARGEFETGFETGGQTREHAMLVRSLGVSQLLAAINKMDMVNWSKERYDEIVQKLGAFLKQAGFKESEVSFIPCSGLNGENLTKPSQEKQLTLWYKGPTLVDQIDKFRPPDRPIIDKPFRMCVSDVFKGMGAGFFVGGTIQAGNIQAGDRVTVIPAGETASVRAVAIDESTVGVGFAGDNITLNLGGMDMINISIGSILCDPLNVIEPTTKFRARIVVFNIDFPITQGFPVVLHYQSVSEQAHIKRLISQLHRVTGEVIKKKPRCLVKNTTAVVDIHVDRPVCVELYRHFKDLGRFMLRSSGSTIAAGIIIEILRDKAEANGTT